MQSIKCYHNWMCLLLAVYKSYPAGVCWSLVNFTENIWWIPEHMAWVNEYKNHHIVRAPTFFGHKPNFNMYKCIQSLILFILKYMLMLQLVLLGHCSWRLASWCFPLFFPFIWWMCWSRLEITRFPSCLGSDWINSCGNHRCFHSLPVVFCTHRTSVENCSGLVLMCCWELQIKFILV